MSTFFLTVLNFYHKRKEEFIMKKKKITMLLLTLSLAVSFSFMGAGTVFGASFDAKGDSASAPVSADSFSLQNSAPTETSVNAGGTLAVSGKTNVLINYAADYNKRDTFFVIKPAKSGALNISTLTSTHVSVNGSEPQYVNYNASYDWMKTITYGVQKGKTYKIKVSGYGTQINITNGDRNYYNKVYIDTAKFTGKAGKSERKASKIKKNKVRKGFVVKKGKAKYYKFSKRGKTVKVSFVAQTDDRIRVTVKAKAYGFRNYKMTSTVGRGYNVRTLKLSLHGKVRHMNGIIKVKPYKKSSGTYTLKYK